MASPSFKGAFVPNTGNQGLGPDHIAQSYDRWQTTAPYSGNDLGDGRALRDGDVPNVMDNPIGQSLLRVLRFRI